MSGATSSRATSGRWAIAIMAAGKGTRLKSRDPKVLHRIGGKPLLEHVIAAATAVVPARDVFAIIGHEAERVRAAVAHTGVNFVEQTEQRGTGHAIMSAASALYDYQHVLVLSGDVPLLRPETILALRDFHNKKRAAMTILTAAPADPGSYGRVVRKGKSEAVTAIVEVKALKPSQRKLREINSGIYAFETAPLLAALPKLTTANAHHEYYLTDVAALLVKARKKVLAIKAADTAGVLGVNTRAELAALDATLRQRKCAELMDAGVTIYRPETCVIDAAVEIEPDVVIHPFVQLLGATRIASGTQVMSYSVLTDAEIGADVTIRPGCIINESKVAAKAVLGPYSHIRPASDIGEGAHIGNFVEVKKTKVGRGSKANHLTYLGDAIIGEGVNVGAGTITCNYDGVHKHQTVIEDGVFIGSDSILVAPVKIGRGAYTAAGSTITDDVPADALALGRARQAIKEGWAVGRKKK